MSPSESEIVPCIVCTCEHADKHMRESLHVSNTTQYTAVMPIAAVMVAGFEHTAASLCDKHLAVLLSMVGAAKLEKPAAKPAPVKSDGTLN